MKLLHVLTAKSELIGQTEDRFDAHMLHLCRAVVVIHATMPDGNRVRSMIALEKDGDYVNGNIIIHPQGAIVIRLNEMGAMAKQYYETITEIRTPKPGEMENILASAGGKAN